MKFTLLAACGLLVLGATLARPAEDSHNGLDEENEIPYKKPVKKGVAVQWGGYHASAGLGGGPAGGGLYAQAGVPGSAHAGAGLYGGTEGSGSQSGGVDYGTGPKPPGQNGDGFFDRIFAIPINILHSVNTYVKSRKGPHQGGPQVSGESGAAGPVAGASASAGASYSGDSGVRFGAALEESSSPATAGAGAGHGKPGQRPDYDKIFNIPISALKSVNDFLNG